MAFADLLVHTVDIWRPAGVADGYGGITRTLTNVDTGISGKIVPLQGREIQLDDRNQPRAEYKLIIVPKSTLNPEDYIFWDDPIKEDTATGTIDSHDDDSDTWIADSGFTDDLDDYWNDAKLIVTTGDETETKVVKDFDQSLGKITPTEAFTITLTDDTTTYALYFRVKFEVVWIAERYHSDIRYQQVFMKRFD